MKDATKMILAVEYTYCTLAEGYDLPPNNKCSGYDTKLSDGKAPVLEL